MEKIAVQVEVEERHFLEQCISPKRKHLIQELSVIGYYYTKSNSSFIKDLCNDSEDGSTKGKLEILDLSKAKILQSGNNNPYSLFGTEFSNCKTLKTIVLSRLDSINAKCFSGCTSLESIYYVGNEVFITRDGILYQKGKRDSKDFSNFELGEWILVKYPSAKKESSDIKFRYINRIADYAFEDSKVTDLYMDTVPPFCSEEAFFNVDITKITLHVPMGSYHSYWSHPVWGDFRIVEEER